MPCKKLEPVLEEFIKTKDNWEVVSINMDANYDLAKHYSVKSVPTLLAFNGDKNTLKHVGFISISDLKEKLNTGN